MKPSDRINEIYQEIDGPPGFWPSDTVDMRIKIRAIMQYLDEQYEKNKQCEHRDAKNLPHSGMKECPQCGAVGVF